MRVATTSDFDQLPTNWLKIQAPTQPSFRGRKVKKIFERDLFYDYQSIIFFLIQPNFNFSYPSTMAGTLQM